MNIKKIFVAYSSIDENLPLSTFDNLKSVADYLCCSINYVKTFLHRESCSFKFSCEILPVIIDEDDEEENVKYAISGYYGKTGEFFGEYSDYGTAKVCCDKLIKKGCYHIIMSEIETKKIIYEVYNELQRNVK